MNFLSQFKYILFTLPRKAGKGFQLFWHVLHLFIFAVLMLVIYTKASASPYGLVEEPALKRIVHELNATQHLISEAQRRSDHQSRFRFNYRCLILDINLIKTGLNNALIGTRHGPRKLQSLCADYGATGRVGGEAAMLQQLMQELQALSPIITEAMQLHNQRSRVNVNYIGLLGDLELIIVGIERALIGAGDQTRSFPPLRGKAAQ